MDAEQVRVEKKKKRKGKKLVLDLEGFFCLYVCLFFVSRTSSPTQPRSKSYASVLTHGGAYFHTRSIS